MGGLTRHVWKLGWPKLNSPCQQLQAAVLRGATSAVVIKRAQQPPRARRNDYLYFR